MLKRNIKTMLLMKRIRMEKPEETWVNIGMLGWGRYSNVLHVTKKGESDKYAMKIPKNYSFHAIIDMEISIHSKLSHPNILKYIASFSYRSDCRTGDMTKISPGPGIPKCIILEKAAPINVKTFSAAEIPKFAKDILNALIYLQSTNVLHRDIKPENVLQVDGTYKLADFGLSIRLKTPPKFITHIGTPFYQPLECLEHPHVHSFSSETWSVGVMVFMLEYGFVDPFPVNSMYELIEYLKNIEEKLPLKGRLSDDFVRDALFKRLDTESLFVHSYLL